jgi:hypothetical protein
MVYRALTNVNFSPTLTYKKTKMDGWVGSIKYNACSKGVMLTNALSCVAKRDHHPIDYLSLTLDQNE